MRVHRLAAQCLRAATAPLDAACVHRVDVLAFDGAPATNEHLFGTTDA